MGKPSLSKQCINSLIWGAHAYIERRFWERTAITDALLSQISHTVATNDIVSATTIRQRTGPHHPPTSEIAPQPDPEVSLTPPQTTFFPIQDLPAELFIQILLLSINRNSSSGDIYKHVLRLAQVNKFWRTTVVNCPSFWSRLVQYLPPETWDSVLRNNPEGPLEVTCMNYNNPAADLEGFLELAAPHSKRWSGMWFRGMLTSKVLRHLELPTSQMTELGICRTRGAGSPERRIKLSDGACLRYLDIDGMALPWNSPRLSGLRVIQLSGIRDDIPTSSQVVAMLQGSPQLWWLLLSYLGRKSEGSSDSESDSDSDSDSSRFRRTRASNLSKFRSNAPTIHLPHLSTMMLDHIPDEMMHTLLTSIDAPNCECLSVDILDVPFIQLRNHTFHTLLSHPVRHSTRMLIQYSQPLAQLYLHSSSGRPEIPNDWVNYIEESPGFNIVINVRRANIGTNPSVITELIRAIGITKPVGLKISGSFGPDFPKELLEEWDFITEIDTTEGYNAEGLLQYLARPKRKVVPAPLGTLERSSIWLCPDLDKLSLGSWPRDGGLSAEIIMEQFFQSRYGLDVTREHQIVRRNTPLQKGKLVLPTTIGQSVLTRFPELEYID
ncbi:hypothetical protein FRB90_011332 [Tulasnella sp. 427]|nr:hypothetical protein FRB90_011332 [Tulasnella sp. 427]